MTNVNLSRILFFNPDIQPVSRRETLTRVCEIGTLICLIALAAAMPFADITAAREIALYLGLFFWAARMILAGKWDMVRTPLDLPLALFAAAALISLITAVDPAYTFDQIKGELLPHILILYLAVNNLRTESRAVLVFTGLLIGALVMDGYGIVYFLNHAQSLTDQSARLISLHEGAPQLWTYLLQTVPYIMMGVLWFKNRPVRALFIAFLALHTLTLYMTFGRMALIVFILQVGLILILLGVRMKWIGALCLIGVTVLIVFLPRQYFVFGEEAKNVAHIGPIGIYGEAGARPLAWGLALRYIADHPFSGLGYGRRSFNIKYPEPAQTNPNMWHVHNVFIRMAVSAGIQGLAAFCFLVFRVFKFLWPGRSRPPAWLSGGIAGPVIAGTFIMVFGFIINNLTNDLYADDSALMFWLLVGLAFSLKIFSPKRHQER